jgi:MFS family permease
VDPALPFQLQPELAMSMAAKLLGTSWLFYLLTVISSGWVFVKFGRRGPIFLAYLLGVFGCLLMPVVHKIYPGLYWCLVMIQIGAAITQNTPLVADYVTDESMSKAVALQGLVSTGASVFTLTVLFRYTKNLEFNHSLPLSASLFLLLGTVAVLLMNPRLESLQVQEQTHSVLTYKFCVRLCFNDINFAVCMVGAFISEMGFLLSFLFMTGWLTKYLPDDAARELS